MLAPPALAAALPQQIPVQRQALYLGDGGDALFGWYHTAPAAHGRDCVAVICPPLGHEYVHSHRSLRCLADTLARAGMPALRFDFHGTGDSPGTDLDPDRLSRWLDDIRTAMAEARALSGRSRVCLLGLRMGATLAALLAADTEVDLLVLWGAAASGRRYLREMQVIAQAGELAAHASGPVLEPAGFLISPQTQEQLKALQLSKQAIRARDGVLVVTRDDLEENTGLLEHLQSLGLSTETFQGAGFAQMMAEPHHVVVPHATLDRIVDWAARHSLAMGPALPPPPARAAFEFNFATDGGEVVALHETHAMFGSQGSLFGIHTRPVAPHPGLPTVVLFSSGAVHRVGPSRAYTALARHLAARGYPCFRCDLEGIGDSVAPKGGLEGHPYPPTATRDAGDILHFVASRFGASRLVLAGVCSGSYTAFQAALHQPDLAIADILLINPLIFAYDGGELPDVQSFRLAESSKGAMRRLDSWKKLLRGQIRVGYLLGMATRHLARLIASHARTLAEMVTLRAASPLSRQLQQLFRQGRRITVILAEGEAGWNILHAGARRTARIGVSKGDLQLLRIEQADHTFSSAASRQRLVRKLLDTLDARFRSDR